MITAKIQARGNKGIVKELGCCLQLQGGVAWIGKNPTRNEWGWFSSVSWFLCVCVCGGGGGDDSRVEGGSNANAMTGCNRSVCVGVGADGPE